MNRRCRLLIIIPSMRGGGAERILINLLHLFDEREYSIDLFIAVKDGNLISEIPDWVRTYSIYPNNHIARLANQLYYRLGLSQLIKIFGRKIRRKYDVGISFLDSLYSELLLRNRAEISKKVAVIHSSYVSNPSKLRYIVGRHLERMKRRYSEMNKLVFVSHQARNEFTHLFGKHKDTQVIYNPMGSERIKRLAVQFVPEPLKTDKTKLVAVGNLLPVKNYFLLIDACKLLVSRNIDFVLNILGSGPLSQELNRRVEMLGLRDIISLRGYRKNPYPWIGYSDIFVMTSVAEGLPTSLCEAMILGRPTVVTNVAGCRELVDNGRFGICVDSNAVDLSMGLTQMINDVKTRQYYEIQSRLRAGLFDDQECLKQYREIIGNKS